MSLHLHVNEKHEVYRVSPDGYPGVVVSEDEFVKILTDEVFPSTGLLPPVVKWFSATKRNWIFERSPMMATISYHHAKPYHIDATSKEHKVTLPIPWTIYAVQLDETYFPIMVSVFVSSGPICDLSQPIGVLPLPNHYPNGLLCVPSNVRPVVAAPKNISEGLALAYQMAWMGGFNTDLLIGVQQAYCLRQPPELFEGAKTRLSLLKMYAIWEKASLAQVNDWSWPAPSGNYGSTTFLANRWRKGAPWSFGTLVQCMQQAELGHISVPNALIWALQGTLARTKMQENLYEIDVEPTQL